VWPQGRDAESGQTFRGCGATNKVGIYLSTECDAFIADKKATPVCADPIARTPSFDQAPHFVLRLFAE
jgi:hypothetical protein